MKPRERITALQRDTRAQPIGIAHFVLVLVGIALVFIIMSVAFEGVQTATSGHIDDPTYQEGRGYIAPMFLSALVPFFGISVIGLLTYTIYKRPGGI
ncbi:MAG: hypothetical protein ACNS61_14190 [Candidatus Wenzhouxiangella sp. M2_3B_020]